jgi:predicted nuclease of predicted toxin-antitoxin system
VPRRLLLDEMLPGSIAEQLCAKGYDVQAVVTTPVFASLPDEEILIGAAEAGRSLVTADIKDFISLDARFRATGRSHAGLILISTKAFPQNRTFVRTVISALDALLAGPDTGLDGQVLFLQPRP